MSSLLALPSPGWIRRSRLSSEPSAMPSVTLSVSNTGPGAVWGEGPTWLSPSRLDGLPTLSDSPSRKMWINRKAKEQERNMGGETCPQRWSADTKGHRCVPEKANLYRVGAQEVSGESCHGEEMIELLSSPCTLPRTCHLYSFLGIVF